MAELSSTRDIKQISMDLLKQSGAIDVFPTPVERIVSCADLIVSGEVDLAHHKESFISRIAGAATSAWDNLRGFLDRAEKIIYLDKSVNASRQNFVQLHETGHDILPWQGAALSCADNDETLSPYVKEEFEAEANYFASATLFQQDRFDKEVREMGVGINQAKAIAKKFGASIHATLRRMVEFQNRSCALIVLENRTDWNCTRRDVIQSAAFKKKYGEIFLPALLDRVYPFADDYLNGRKFRVDCDVTMPTAAGLIKMKYEFFFNQYCALVLIYAQGDLAKPKGRYVFKEASER
jgi:IrrE N-terminal-like domain